MSTIRYQKGVLTSFNINIAQLRNPNIVMWWSAAMPGFGHIMLCKYLKGFLLIIWEFSINSLSNLNLGIIYTFTGNFDQAIQVLDTKWALLYVPVYIFSMWDSRRIAIDLNKYAILADSNKGISEISPIVFSTLENNYLDKYNNKLAIFWSFVFPGLGHLYIGRLPSGFYILLWTMVSLYFSNLVPAIHFSFYGDFQSASNVLNRQWLLFLPSMYCFAAYDAYQNCDSFTNLMRKQQNHFLLNHFQKKHVAEKFPFLKKVGGKVNVIASFENTTYLELTLDELKQNGLSNEHVITFPLTERNKPFTYADIIKGNSINLYHSSFVLGTIFSIFGVIYGFVLVGGPILWGLAFLFAGLGIGYLLDNIKIKKRKRSKGEVVVIIQCKDEQLQKIKDILYNNFTNGFHVME